MKSNLSLSIIGGLLVLQGIGFFLGAEQITSQAFAGIELSQQALNVGTAMHQALASVAFGVGIMVLLLRNSSGGFAINLFKGIIAMSGIVLLQAFYAMIQWPGLQPPIPALVLFGFFIALSVISMRKESNRV
ncbi:MAG: hypothetical protein RLZZ337_1618 [Bacteroidota bacterium]|jgi:CHASE2 domain-containing sensor protein